MSPLAQRSRSEATNSLVCAQTPRQPQNHEKFLFRAPLEILVQDAPALTFDPEFASPDGLWVPDAIHPYEARSTRCRRNPCQIGLTFVSADIACG
jgi:hypothetical protein